MKTRTSYGFAPDVLTNLPLPLSRLAEPATPFLSQSVYRNFHRSHSRLALSHGMEIPEQRCQKCKF